MVQNSMSSMQRTMASAGPRPLLLAIFCLPFFASQFSLANFCLPLICTRTTKTHMTLLADLPDAPDATLEAHLVSPPRSISDLPVQRAASPATAAQARALYFNTGNAFNQKLAEVPDQSFIDEPARALHPDSPTGLIECDRSQDLGTPYPATTPLVLVRYARIRAGESLRTEFVASGVVVYVMVGSGTTDCGKEQVSWQAGDVVVLPGNVLHLHSAGAVDAVLWIVTNEPQLAFEHLRGPAEGDAPTELVHFPAQEIERQVDLLYRI